LIFCIQNSSISSKSISIIEKKIKNKQAKIIKDFFSALILEYNEKA